MIRRAVAACLTSAFLLAGCGEAGDSAVVLAAATEPPGYELGDGFRVPEGTVLLGDPIPIGVAGTTDGVENLDEGWTATLLVDGGSPDAIVEDILRQADGKRLDEQPGTACGADGTVWICSGFARWDEDGGRRSLSVASVRGRRHDVVSDHVVVRYSTTALFWEYGRPSSPASSSGEEPLVEPFPPLARTGEPIGTAGETYTAVEVQEGTRLVGPPRLNLNDASGGGVAILQVAGDPQAILARYLDHLEDLNPNLTGNEPRRLDIRGAVLTTAFRAGAGGDHFELTVVERPGRPTWLVIEGSHD